MIKIKKILILMLVGVLFINVVGCKNKEEKLGNSNGNLMNGGKIAFQDDNLYFSIDGILYKSNLDGSEIKKIYEVDGENGYIGRLNVVDNKIIFYGAAGDSAGLYRIKDDGSNLKRLISEPRNGGKEVYTIDKWIYYDDLYKLSLNGDGSDKEKIDHFDIINGTLNIDNGYIYYCAKDITTDEYCIFKMNLDDSTNQKLSTGQVYEMSVYNGYIYYKEENSLYKMKTDGTENQLIIDKNIGDYNVKDDCIYYISEDGSSLYKMKNDGTNNQKMNLNISMIDRYYGLFIVDNWLYFKADNCLQRVELNGSNQKTIFKINSEKNIEHKEKEEQEKFRVKLNNTYQTRFGEVNMVTFPTFEFDFPSSWNVSEEISQDREIVTLSNERGVTVTYSHLGIPVGTDATGGSTVSMSRVNASKVADSSFVPTYVQGTDYSNLGKFVVAELKVTGTMDMRHDSEFTDIDGSVSYAVIPESRIGLHDDVRNPYCVEFGFKYGSGISFIASAPEDGFTWAEKKVVIDILKSFRVE